MKTVPGIATRHGEDKPVQVRCTCGLVIATLPPGERLDRAGEVREVACTCGKVTHLRVVVDRG